MLAQDNVTPNRKPRLCYSALRDCLQWVRANYSSSRIVMPLIGSGIAGGDYRIIEKLIAKCLGSLDVNVYVLRVSDLPESMRGVLQDGAVH